MARVRSAKPVPTCPTAWNQGPYRMKDGVRVDRLKCPVCERVGVIADDGVMVIHS